MALEMNIDAETFEALPETVQAEYSARDEGYQLDVNGVFSEVDRTNLQKALTAERGVTKGLKAKVQGFGELTPEDAATLQHEHAELTTKIEGLEDPTKLEEAARKLAEGQVAAAVSPLQRQLEELQGQLGTVTGERDVLSGTLTSQGIQGDVLKAFKGIEGINPDAVDDVLLWTEKAFERGDDGETRSTDFAGATPGLPPSEVFKEMARKNQRSHWFGATQGSGASGSGGGKPRGENPFGKDGKIGNMTEAMKMASEDPRTAASLAKQAGTIHFFPTLKGA